MGEEFFVKPVDSARTFAVQDTKVKSEPAKTETAPAKAKTESQPPEQGADHNAWQTSNEVKDLIESLAGLKSELSIVMDPETRQIIVKVLDSTTGEVIRRMPLKDPVHRSDDPWGLTGLLLDTRE